MLADQLDYVVGVDPHRDLHALAVVHERGGTDRCALSATGGPNP